MGSHAAQKVFSFHEIVSGREANVRVTDDGLLYAVDLVMVMSGKNRDDAGKALRNLPGELFSSADFTEKKTAGSGNTRVKVLTFEKAIELVMVLPGRVAKETRTQFANIIRRYLAGDHSLIKEIQANAQSDSPVAQMARESLGISTDEDLKRKRQRQDIDIVAAKQQNVITFLDIMERIDPNWKKDERLVVQTKDLVTNITLGPRAITNASEKPGPINIQEVALEIGLGRLNHGNSCKIGKRAAELYRATHDQDPPKRLQFVDGAERKVYAYTEAERDLVERAIREVMSE